MHGMHKVAVMKTERLNFWRGDSFSRPVSNCDFILIPLSCPYV